MSAMKEKRRFPQTQSRRRGRTPATESQAKKARLLAVARREFARHGYRNATMDGIAEAANITKRSLYLWHADKEALFMACFAEGTARFPRPEFSEHLDFATNLRNYALALANEFASEYAFGMGLLLVREARDFPELARALHEGQELLLLPLADYLRLHGFEEIHGHERAEHLIAMVLGEVHRALLTGAARPDLVRVRRHALVAVDIFLSSGRIAGAHAAHQPATVNPPSTGSV